MVKTVQKNNFSLRYGDLFDNITSYINQGHNGCSILIPHVCNNINVFGAGFAGAVSRHFPIAKENYHLLGKQNVLGYVQFIEVAKSKEYNHKIIIANMIAQNGTISKSNPRPLNYYSLAKCMANVNLYIHQNFDSENRVQIHAPKFGCGLAGGNWNFIEDLIRDIWSQQSIFIYDIRK
jgi:hypothetical protein